MNKQMINALLNKDIYTQIVILDTHIKMVCK